MDADNKKILSLPSFLSFSMPILGSIFISINTIAMIHISKIHIIAALKDKFSLCWVAKDGRRIFCPECKLTSFHSKGRTMNVVLLSSGEIRKVNRYSIIEFNGEEVVM